MPDKPKFTGDSASWFFYWQYLLLTWRLVALAVSAVYSVHMVFGVVGGHIVVMFIWLLFLDTHLYEKWYQNVPFKGVMALIYAICYVTFKGGNSTKRHVFYYMLVYCENAVLLMMWSINSEKTYKIVWLGVAVGLFGILLPFVLNSKTWEDLVICPRQREEYVEAVMQQEAYIDNVVSLITTQLG